MKNNSTVKLLSLVLCIVLTAALALTGCSGSPAETTEAPKPSAPVSAGEVTVLGEGAKVVDFSILDKDGVEHLYEIHTDAEMVGQALIEHELIAGEEGPYGMYIKSVLGQELDYNTDGMYWAFYINGEYAMTGVDQTPIAEGERYRITAEAG